MIAHVALPIPVAKTFSYAVPGKWSAWVNPFQRLRVPFRNRVVTGYVVALEERDPGDFKEVLEVSDLFPFLSADLIGLGRWASRHYITPLGLVLKYALPQSLAVERHLVVETETEGLGPVNGNPFGKACQLLGREALFRYFSDGRVRLRDVFTGELFVPPEKQFREGEIAENIFCAGNAHGRFEYYATRISEALDSGGNVLFLLPDYHTSGEYFFRRLEELFPGQVLWYSSAVGNRAMMKTYFRARHDKRLVILGNRNCTFLPVGDLSMIIVERPEEDDYRNEEGFRFDAAVLAGKRAEIGGIPLVFGAASLGLETYRAVMAGTLRLVPAPPLKKAAYHEIATGGETLRGPGLSEKIFRAVADSLERGKNAVVFTPRRDYSSYLYCYACRKPLTCPLCGAVLTFQKARNLLSCPACSRNLAYSDLCERCGGSLVTFSRIGAEYIEEEMKKTFPGVPVVKITGEAAERGRAGKRRRILPSAPFIVVGTPVLGKFYDIPAGTLVLAGWEETLRLGGFKAGERTFHTLMNLLDSLAPDELFVAIDVRKGINPHRFLDPERFLPEELLNRKIAGFPPWVRLFLIELTGRQEARVEKAAADVKALLDEAGFPAEATKGFSRKKGEFLCKILLKSSEEAVGDLLLGLYDRRGIRIEADPLSI
jgi:primosomal protein N' (replication factor Y)